MSKKSKPKTTYQLAYELMESKRNENKCSDFKHTIEVLHGDRTHCIFQNAYAELTDINGYSMLLVYTEHCGYFPFYMEDLESWREYVEV